MPEIKELRVLLQSMNPVLQDGQYVYCKVNDEFLNNLRKSPLMIFKEDEAYTLVLEKNKADSLMLDYEDTWELVTLSVYSSLTAVGFIAVVTQQLASHGISTNVISAFYHDHILVPYGKGEKAIELLKDLQKSESH